MTDKQAASASAKGHLAQRNINPPVFLGASLIIVAIIVFAIAAPQTADSAFKRLQAAIVDNAGWYYILTVALILITTVYLGMSRYGSIKLGPDHSKPDYSNVSWFAMLFSAGMGIGLMFFGVAEPVMHFLSPPQGEGSGTAAAREAMRLTFFHWGLHAWSIYAIVALILAFFAYRHNLPLTLRSALYPLIGERIYGPIGHAVDIFAVVGTLFGVATSLGYGVLQINTGLNHLFPWFPVSVSSQIILIAAVTLLATLSVASGLDKGVKLLSELNLGLAVVLLLFVLFAGGSTVFLLQALVQNTGYYASNIVSMTFNMYAYQKTDWLGGWTILYWGWWISWAPFVGLFIARVSRGRTIRQFVTGVLLVPTGFTFIWMTVFGNSAIDMILNQGLVSLGQVVDNDVSLALFAFLEYLPFSTLFTYIALLMVVVFFITSADSGALVMDMLSAHGRGSTGIGYRMYWSVGAGLVAVVLLLAGGLGSLQTMTIASALPFVTVLMVAIYGLMKALQVDIQKQQVQQQILAPPLPGKGSDAWRERLQVIMDFPSREAVGQFLTGTVAPACEEVAAELVKNGVRATVSPGANGRVELTVFHGEEIDFTYKVKSVPHILPAFVQQSGSVDEAAEEQKYYRAEVHLGEGGQDYDIMGWSREGVINDIVAQYHKHMHFLHSLR